MLLVTLLNVLIALCSAFLILVVLVQRGKGGGLVGALGGMGGSSAFGTRAGDVFTRVTIGVAVVWFLLAIILVKMMAAGSGSRYTGGAAATSGTGEPGISAPAETETPSPAAKTPSAPAANAPASAPPASEPAGRRPTAPPPAAPPSPPSGQP